MKYSVPEWAKGIIWYQIYPERFCNGNPQINPVLSDQKNSYPHDLKSPWKLHPWTSDWYKLQGYERVNGKNIWHNIHRRRYGGDLQGIINKLDYLQDLGIGGIYLNPVFTSPSHHKYDSATYHHIDPTFGPDPEGDKKIIAGETPDDPNTWQWTSADKLFLKLIREVHNRDMRIIIDGVFNHVGLNFWAFQDVKKHQQQSRFANWFKIAQWDNPQVKESFAVHTWEGFNELPEWKESRMGPVKGPREYIFNITQRWMDPLGNGDTRAGIDGWRLDVAHDVKHNFWKIWKEHVREINPEAYTTGEVIRSPEEQAEYLQGDEFDAVMNYYFARCVFDFFGSDHGKPSVFAEKLTHLQSTIPGQMHLSMQNLLDSHDTNRVLSQIKNRGLFDEFDDWWTIFETSRAENPEYDTAAPNETELHRLKLMVIFQMCFPGAPMIYYGDELGMWGANDPCCRKPMLWPELTFDEERYTPSGEQLPVPNMVTANMDIHAFYKHLIAIRKNYPALQTGDFTIEMSDDNKGLFAFKRSRGHQQIIIVFNMSDTSQEYDAPANCTRIPLQDEEKPDDQIIAAFWAGLFEV